MWNLDESHMHYAKKKIKKCCILHDSIYIFKKGKAIEIEDKSVISKNWGREAGIDYKGAYKTYESDGNILYFSCGGSYITICYSKFYRNKLQKEWILLCVNFTVCNKPDSCPNPNRKGTTTSGTLGHLEFDDARSLKLKGSLINIVRLYVPNLGRVS